MERADRRTTGVLRYGLVDAEVTVMMVIDNRFELGQRVYLVTDREQSVRIVNAIEIGLNGCLSYRTVCGTVEYWASDSEISIEKTIEYLAPT